MNRLKLDFSLDTTVERTNFLNKYIDTLNFTPNETELETMANYVLWGKDPITGLNAKQSKEVQLESRNKTWDAHQDESYEALIETPGFTETMIKPSNEPGAKIQRIVFSREEARKHAPSIILQSFEELWSQIDHIDLLLNFYDLKTGKRKNPPRAELLNKFNEDEIQQSKEKAKHLNQFNYLKLRHLLVELRRQQFSLRDNYISPIVSTDNSISPAPTQLTIDAEVECYPIGLKYENLISKKLFPKERFPVPTDFSEKELEYILHFYWEKKEKQKTQNFDFRNLEHVYQALLLFYEIEEENCELEIISTSKEFLDTLNYYIQLANLSEIHKEILDLKMKHKKNQYVADYVNQKYEKSYTANYISTIFRQKIIPQINDIARQHAEVIENLCFPENWKQCKHCGKVLLVNTDNFVRKSRSSDGFSNQCKRCDKIIRRLKK